MKLIKPQVNKETSNQGIYSGYVCIAKFSPSQAGMSKP